MKQETDSTGGVFSSKSWSQETQVDPMANATFVNLTDPASSVSMSLAQMSEELPESLVEAPTSHFELTQEQVDRFKYYNPKDPDDYKRETINNVIKAFTQQDDYEGRLLNQGKPVADTDQLYRMLRDTIQGNTHQSAKMAEWSAIPKDAFKERYELVQRDKGWWDRTGEKIFNSIPHLTDEEAAEIGDDVYKANLIFRDERQNRAQQTERLAESTRRQSGYAGQADMVDSVRGSVRSRDEAGLPEGMTPFPDHIALKKAGEIVNPHRVVKAYENMLHAQNAFAMAAGIMPKLSARGQAVARDAITNGGYIKDSFQKEMFGSLPEEEQELIAALTHSAKTRESNAIFSAIKQMGKRFVEMPQEASLRYGDMIFGDELPSYAVNRNKRVNARLRAVNSLNTEEFGFWANSLVGASESVPYMVYNTLFGKIKYIGAPLSFAFLMPSYQDQIEERIAMSGGDVTGNTAKIASFAGAFAQVAIERLQVKGWWGRITNQNAKEFAMRTAFMEFAKKFERTAWAAIKNGAFELGEETIQRGAEEVAVGLGVGNDGSTILRDTMHGMWNEANESFGAILLMSGGSSVIEGAQNMRGRFQLSTQDLIGIEKTALKLRENLEKGEFNGIKASYKDIAYLARSIMDSPNPVAKAQELGLSEDGAKWLAGTMAGAMEGVNSSSALSQAQKDELLQYRSFTAAEFLKNNFANSEVTENEDGTLDVSMQVTNRTGETDTVKFRVIQDEKVGTLTAEIIDNMDANLAQSVVSYFKGQGVDIGAVNEETLLTMPPEERRAFFTAHPVRVNGKFSMTAPTGAVVTDADINTLNGWITVDPQDIGTSFHEAMHGFMRWMVDTKQFSGEEIDALVTKYGKGSGAMPWNDETFARDYHTYMNSRAARGEFIRTKSELVFEKIGASLSKLGGYLTFWRKRQGNIEAASNNILEAARRGNFSGVKILFSEASLMPSEIQSDYTAADAEAEANASAQADADDAANAQNSVDSEEFKGIKTSELKAKAQSEERILENKNLPEEEIEQHAQLLDRVSAELERRFNSRTPAQRAAVTRMRRGRMENTLLGTLNRFNEEQPGNPILELIAEGMGVLTKPRGPGTNHKGQNKFLRKGETPRSSDYGYDSLSDLPPKLAKLLFKEDSFGGVDGDLEELALMPGFQMYAGDNADLFARDVLNQWSKFEQWEEEQYKRSKPQYWEEDGVSGEYAIMDAGDIPAVGMGEVLAGIEANAYSVDFPILSASGELIVGNSENFVITTAEIAEKHGILLDENIKRPVLVRIASPETSADALRSLNETNDFDDRFSVTGAEDLDIRYSIVSDKDLLKRLESEKTVKAYRAMQVIDGKLYPPMAAKVNGVLVNPVELGKWEQADEMPELSIDGKFKLDKANGSAIKAAYNPYFHSSRSPLNDQFSSAYKRPNLVTVEVEIPESELTSGYKANGAKDSVGEVSWHVGPVSSKLPKEKARKVILSRYDKPLRIVPDSEVGSVISTILNGEGISVPAHVITPSLREELLKLGVAVGDIRYSVTGAEAEAVVAEYQGTDKWMKAPNGENTNLNERQWIQVQTPSFKKWFEGSKVVDENGEPRVVYHGTPSGGFNEFKPRPTYFTEKQDYADVYHSPSASSIRAWIEEGSPETYEVFINAKNPFDTRKAKHRRQYENEFFGKSGEEWVSNGTPLSERKLPDWTDGSDLAEWINETGQAYDAVILDEGSLPQEDGSVKWRGASWMIPNPSGKTIKSATANTGAFDSANDDIRYSITSVKPWPQDFPKAIVHTTRANINNKFKPLFDEAKAGDTVAAYDLLNSIVHEDKILALAQRHPNAIVVAVHAEEATGRNKIPEAYAKMIGKIGGLEVDESIVQSVRAQRRGKDNWYRLTHRPEFKGDVQPGREYIIVDDHLTMGGTVSELRSFIENGGGKVVEIAGLTASHGSTTLSISQETVGKLNNKFGHDNLLEKLRSINVTGELEALTESEGRYLLSLSPDTLRNRVLEERQTGSFSNLRPALGTGSSQEVESEREDARRSVKSYGGNYGPDAKLVAVAASQIAAGKAVDAAEVQRVAKYLPGHTLTTQEIIDQATEIVNDEKSQTGKDILAALAKGDSHAAQDVAAGAYTRRNLDKLVADAVSGGAAIGEKWGNAGRDAMAKASLNMFDKAPSEDVRKFDLWYGADTATILLKTRPEDFSEAKKKKELSPEQQAQVDAEESVPEEEYTPEEQREIDMAIAAAFNPANVAELQQEQRKRIDRIVKEAKKVIAARRALQAEREAQRLAEANAEAESGADDADLPETLQDAKAQDDAAEKPDDADALVMEVLEDLASAFDVDLSNAAEYAYALRAMFRDYVMHRQGITKGQVFDKQHQENVAQYRKTMQEKLRQMVSNYINPESTGLGMLLRKMIDDIPVMSSPRGIENGVARVLRTLQANAIRQSRNELIKELKVDLKKAAVEGKVIDPLNSDYRRKINMEVEEEVRYILRIIDRGPKWVEAEKEKLKEIIEGRKEAYNAEKENGAKDDEWISDAVVHKSTVRLQLLDRYGALKQLMPAEIKAKGAELREYMAKELRKHYENWWKKESDWAWVRNSFVRGVTYNIHKNRPDKENAWQRFVRSGVSTIEQQLEYMIADCPYDSQEYADARKAIDWILEHIADASTDYANIANAYRKENRDLITAVAGKGNESAYLKHLEEKIPQALSDELHNKEAANNMNFDQAIQLYASLKQTQSYQENIVKHGRGGQIEILETILTEADIKYYRGLVEIYKRRRAALDVAVKQFTGMGVYSPDPVYAPVQMWTGRPNDLPVAVSAYSAFAKSLTPRQLNGRDFNTQAKASDLLIGRSEDAARAISYGNVGVALRAILAGKETQDAMARFSGDEGAAQLMRQVRDTLMHGSPEQLRTDQDGIALGAREFSTLATLGFNLGTGAKQCVSVWTFALAHPDGFGAVWRGMTEGSSEERTQARKELMASKEWQARYGNLGFSYDLNEVFSQPQTTWIKRFYQMGMRPVEIGDMVPGVLVGTGLYLATRNDLVNSGMSYEEASKKAAAQVMALVEKTQQSSRLENLPEIIRRGGPIVKLLFQFSSSPILQASYEINAVRTWRRRVDPEGNMSFRQAVAKSMENSAKGIEDGRKQVFNALMVNHVLMPISMAVASALIKAVFGQLPEKDKWWKEVLVECLLGSFGRILIYGSMAQTGLRSIAGLPVFANQLAADSVITRMGFAGFDVLNDLAHLDFDSIGGDLDDFLSTANAGYRDVSKGVKNWGMEGEKDVKRKRSARKKRIREEN